MIQKHILFIPVDPKPPTNPYKLLNMVTTILILEAATTMEHNDDRPNVPITNHLTFDLNFSMMKPPSMEPNSPATPLHNNMVPMSS